MPELEEKIKLLFELSKQEQQYIKQLITSHEAQARDEIKTLKADIIELKAQVKALELKEASTRPGIDLVFKILGYIVLAGVAYFLGGGNFKK